MKRHIPLGKKMFCLILVLVQIAGHMYVPVRAEEDMVPPVSMKKDQPELTALMEQYYDAMIEQDETSLREIVSPWEDGMAQSLFASFRFEKYVNLSVYSFDRPQSDGSLMYIYFDGIVSGSDTLTPSLSVMYAEPDETGVLKLSSNWMSREEIRVWADEIGQGEEATELVEEIRSSIRDRSAEETETASEAEIDRPSQEEVPAVEEPSTEAPLPEEETVPDEEMVPDERIAEEEGTIPEEETVPDGETDSEEEAAAKDPEESSSQPGNDVRSRIEKAQRSRQKELSEAKAREESEAASETKAREESEAASEAKALEESEAASEAKAREESEAASEAKARKESEAESNAEAEKQRQQDELEGTRYYFSGIWISRDGSLMEFKEDGTMGSRDRFAGCTYEYDRKTKTLSFLKDGKLSRSYTCTFLKDGGSLLLTSTDSKASGSYYRLIDRVDPDTIVSTYVSIDPSYTGCIGQIDAIFTGVDFVYLKGWAFDSRAPEEALQCEVTMSDETGKAHIVGSYLANEERSDVDAGYGCGQKHGFSIFITKEDFPQMFRSSQMLQVTLSGNSIPQSRTPVLAYTKIRIYGDEKSMAGISSSPDVTGKELEEIKKKAPAKPILPEETKPEGSAGDAGSAPAGKNETAVEIILMEGRRGSYISSDGSMLSMYQEGKAGEVLKIPGAAVFYISQAGLYGDEIWGKTVYGGVEGWVRKINGARLISQNDLSVRKGTGYLVCPIDSDSAPAYGLADRSSSVIAEVFIGTSVNVEQVKNGFAYGMWQNEKGQISHGWLEVSSLVPEITDAAYYAVRDIPLYRHPDGSENTAMVPSGTELYVDQIQNGWARTAFAGQTGYVNMGHIRLLGDSGVRDLSRLEKPAKDGTAAAGIHRYELYYENVSWEEAFRRCIQKGGHLVTINDAQEFSHLTSMIMQVNEYWHYRYYIGARRNMGSSSDGNSYYWVDTENRFFGSPLNDPSSWCYREWFQSEPSFRDASLNVEEGYLELLCPSSDHSRYYLNDVMNNLPEYNTSANVYIGYICEYD